MYYIHVHHTCSVHHTNTYTSLYCLTKSKVVCQNLNLLRQNEMVSCITHEKKIQCMKWQIVVEVIFHRLLAIN